MSYIRQLEVNRGSKAELEDDGQTADRTGKKMYRKEIWEDKGSKGGTETDGENAPRPRKRLQRNGLAEFNEHDQGKEALRRSCDANGTGGGRFDGRTWI